MIRSVYYLGVLCLVAGIALTDATLDTDRALGLESRESAEVPCVGWAPCPTAPAGRRRSAPEAQKVFAQDAAVKPPSAAPRTFAFPPIHDGDGAGHRLPNGLNAPLRN